MHGIETPNKQETAELLVSLKRLLAAMERALPRRLRDAKQNFDPNQPRVQAGGPDAGQWTAVEASPPIGSAVTQDEWDRFNAGTIGMAGVTSSERFHFAEIFGVEGVREDQNSHAASGIRPEMLEAAKREHAIPGIERVRNPIDLTLRQRAQLYKWILDRELPSIGGGYALHKIGDKYTAGAIADTLFMHGQHDGATLIQNAIVNVYKQIPIAERNDMRLPAIATDRVFGSRVLTSIKILQQHGYGQDLRNDLANLRIERNNNKLPENERIGAQRRVEHFRFPGDRAR